jgi:hypothetical protein
MEPSTRSSSHPRRRPLRAHVLVIGLSIIGGAVAIFACDDESAPGSAAPDAATVDLDGSGTQDTSTSQGDTSSPPVDAGPDAEDITDGGGVPTEDDGGTTDIDGGFDAGPACQVVTAGAYKPSACLTRVIVPIGGTITTTTYELDQVNVLGSKDFCAGGGYVPYNHRGGLRVTVTGGSAATFEFLDQYRKATSPGGIIVPLATTIRYDVDVTISGNILTYAPRACTLKTAPPTKVLYSVGAVATTGKKTITLRLPYGSGTANFVFVEP